MSYKTLIVLLLAVPSYEGGRFCWNAMDLSNVPAKVQPAKAQLDFPGSWSDLKVEFDSITFSLGRWELLKGFVESDIDKPPISAAVAEYFYSGICGPTRDRHGNALNWHDLEWSRHKESTAFMAPFTIKHISKKVVDRNTSGSEVQTNS